MNYFVFIYTFLFFVQVSSAQRVVEGRVTNIGGGEIAGVEVKAKESPAIFTFTDESGNYRIVLPKEVNYLIFSYSGMQQKTVKLANILKIDVKLVPIEFRKFRFGVGIKTGFSSFRILPNQPSYQITDTIIRLTPISFDIDLYVKIKERFEIQFTVEDDLNFGHVNRDSVIYNEPGDSILTNIEEQVLLNRISIASILSYHFFLEKTGNYSGFVGIGPQFQHFSFLNTGTIGARIQFGVNLNNFGKTLKIYSSIDIAGGTFGNENIYVPELKYDFVSTRIGLNFIF
jgi:hypothetical protein